LADGRQGLSAKKEVENLPGSGAVCGTAVLRADEWGALAGERTSGVADPRADGQALSRPEVIPEASGMRRWTENAVFRPESWVSGPSPAGFVRENAGFAKEYAGFI
jgi:hypothetical protein